MRRSASQARRGPQKAYAKAEGRGRGQVQGPDLPDTPNDEAFGFERLPDLGDLVALDFDGPIFHRTAGAARRAQFLSRFLDLREWQVCGEIINHHDRLSAPMRGFAPEENAAHFPDWLVRAWRRCACGFSQRDVQILERRC